MSTNPNEKDVATALAAAGSAHHDYEQNALGGERDQRWAGWYAAYVLGRLGDFTTPISLAKWLEEAPSGGDWAQSAAKHVKRELGP
jgi:hypothetical protein